MQIIAAITIFLASISISDISHFEKALISKGMTQQQIDMTREDIFSVLEKCSKAEIEFLEEMIISGKISGQSYEGNYACMIGTIAKARGTSFRTLTGIKPDMSRPLEKYFLKIDSKDTPMNNVYSLIALLWIREYKKEQS